MRNRYQRVADAALLYGFIERQLAERGIRSRIETDFDLFADTYAALAGKTVYPMFDPALSDITSGFWLIGEKDGAPVHIQALRFWDLGAQSLADHVGRHARLYCDPTEIEIDPRSTIVRNAEAGGLYGTAFYQGQLWLDPSLRSIEIDGIPLGRGILPKLGMLVATMSHDIDFMYGIAADPAAQKGLVSSYGYYSISPGAVIFCNQAGDPLSHKGLFWSRASGLDELIRHFLDLWKVRPPG